MRDRMRENNFDLLRLAFAGGVVLWHLHVLAQVPALAPLARVLFLAADWGVKGFFVISGYLVVASFENSAGVGEYASKRIRRIYPAYAAIVLASALCGAFLSTLPAAEYFAMGWIRYLAANLAFLNFLAPELPGVFAGQRYTEVNGALWTLKIEVMFYAFVPVLAWLMARGRAWAVLAALYLGSVAYSVALGTLHERSGDGIWMQLQRQLPGQLAYFIVGSGLYAYRDRVAGHSAAMAAVAVVSLFALDRYGGDLLKTAFEPLVLGVLVVVLATGARQLGNAARHGDFSYGLYIIHFPVLQAAISMGVFAWNPLVASIACVAVITALAAASWHFVERPFLLRRSHYRLAQEAGG